MDFQYNVGQSYEIDENCLRMCSQGFHFCLLPVDVFDYYDGNDVVYAIIKADGKVLEDGNKCVTNKITIIEQLTREQLMLAMPPMIERLCGN